MAQDEDWWHLCYDTEAKSFFVQHEWHYVQIRTAKVDQGTETHDADTWTGRGADRISAAKEILLEQAAAR